MTPLLRLQATERHILEQAGETVDHGDYVVLRSASHPGWYQANMIELRSGQRSLSEWVDVFRAHFDEATYGHVTIFVPDVRAFAPLLSELDGQDGWHVQRITYMLASSTRRAPAVPDGLVVRPVESEQDWCDLIEFAIEESRGEPWFTSESEVRRHLETKRWLSERIDIQWLRLMRADDREILSRLGIFDHAGVSRLQAVGTAGAHRRQGLASALLGHAIRLAIDERRTAGLGLGVETGTSAHRLYASLGFEPVGDECWIMRYPRRG